jgi:glycosyltransferase involved in cell wall biosynthesis
MSKTLVSIIVPCYERDDGYGQAKYLAYTLSSTVIQQQPFEVIVVDDGSPYEHRIAEIVKGFPNVKYVRSPTNVGTAAARNLGIRESSGEYILPLDGDDALTKHAVGLLRFALTSRPAAGVAYGAMLDITATKYVWSPTCNWTLCELRDGNRIPSSSMFTRKAWEAAGGYDESRLVHEDWDLWLAIANKGFEFVHVWQPVVMYRSHPNQQSHWMPNRDDIAVYMAQKYEFMNQLSAEALKRQVAFPIGEDWSRSCVI